MNNQTKLILLGAVIVAIVIVIILIVKNTNKSNIRKHLDDLTVRFNAIKTIPLAFKLNKAQAMAKRNEETSEQIDSYYERYKDVQQSIDETAVLFEDGEDAFAVKDYKQAAITVECISEKIEELEKEVKTIDEFLDVFSKKENEQRSTSAQLKEVYRELKMNIAENAKKFSIGYEGIEKKLEKCEDLFSQSEEWMYANDYARANETLSELENDINNVKLCVEALPDLIKDAKGVIPVLEDEANRQNDLSRQRGIYIEHLHIEDRFSANKESLNQCLKAIMEGYYGDTATKLEDIKKDFNDILEKLDIENKAYDDCKSIYDQITSNIENDRKLFAYVEGSYQKDADRYDFNEMGQYIIDTKKDMALYGADCFELSCTLTNNLCPPTELKGKLEDLFNKTEETRCKLLEYKQSIDKNTKDEDRAKTQLIKLQVVLNEVEVKVMEYHLPSIASNYKDDLEEGRRKIAEIKKLLEAIPLDIDELNKTLDAAIDYIYTFYNNVNNIVGMAIMVENAIVFGNKYRSTYATVDRDLSNAEFAYLNGEYTKALTMAIACMETLFPNKANEKILENS